jgi:hypothetical protein
MKAITDLTAEELALVQAAREKAEQEKAAKQAQFEKDITDKRAYAEKEILRGEKQVKATYDYFKGFKSGEFEVVEYPLYREITIKDWNVREILFKEDYVVNSAYVKHIESGRKIRVDEHFVYSKFGRSNKGYKMFIEFEARAYSKASTIETKLLNEINSIRAKQSAEEIRSAYIADLIETQPIPNAKIAKAYISSNYVTSPYGLEIQYSNGSLVTCSINVTEKGEAILSVFKTEFPKPKIEGDTVMDKLKFISKLEF